MHKMHKQLLVNDILEKQKRTSQIRANINIMIQQSKMKN